MQRENIRLKVLSWNAQGESYCGDYAVKSEVLGVIVNQEHPDFVFICECGNLSDNNNFIKVLNGLKYNYVYGYEADRCSYIIFCKWPSKLLYRNLTIPGLKRPIVLFNLKNKYTENVFYLGFIHNNSSYKAEAIAESIYSKLADYDAPYVIAGDFNLLPNKNKDIFIIKSKGATHRKSSADINDMYLDYAATNIKAIAQNSTCTNVTLMDCGVPLSDHDCIILNLDLSETKYEI